MQEILDNPFGLSFLSFFYLLSLIFGVINESDSEFLGTLLLLQIKFGILLPPGKRPVNTV